MAKNKPIKIPKHRSRIPPPGGPIGKKGYNRKKVKKDLRATIEDFEKGRL